MNITFLGAAKTVTGSNFLVEAAGKKFLVDCGMYQGKASQEIENSEDFLYNPQEIDFMLLTHAHIDHSGRIPKLYNEGFRAPIYAHRATVDLCAIMLPDSGHIQENEVEWKNRKRVRAGLEPLPPLYTAEEAAKSMEIFKKVEYDEIVDVAENIQVRFNDAGHMLGSSIIEIWVTENGKTEKIVFTGDIGNNDIPLLDSPTMIENADYLVMESTYGSRHHLRNDDKANIFLDVVSETLDKGGRVVIPSFAVGRTQEILYEIDKIKDAHKDDEEFQRKYEQLMKVPVFVDSPLAISATEVFRKNIDLFEEEIQEKIKLGDFPLDFSGLQFTQTADESKALNETYYPSIIISASGMCDIGRIKHHLKHNLWNPNSTILFVGYQAPGTLGRTIVDGADKVKIFGEEITVNARIEYIEGYSGHADQEWLLNFVYSFINKPKHIFLVHGEEESQEVLKTLIEANTAIPVTIPSFGEKYEASDIPKLQERMEYSSKMEDQFLRLQILEKLEKITDEINDMTKTVKEEKLMKEASDVEVEKLNDKVKKLEEQIKSLLEG
ncbi:MAG: MBL fold metallo-hydrolase RNA specificity domain-containing protein [Clostridia bacterium]|nr:MBL fold metallo-hydrolase [Clostridia bacterium]